MDIDRIFDLFSPTGGNEENSSVLDIYEHPAFKIGMFKKWISNIPYAIKYSIKDFGDFDDKEQIDNIKSYVAGQIYRKAFEYLEEINLENHKEVIKNNIDPKFKFALEACMNHFIYTEEYEKCSVLKKFQDLYKENLPS